MCCDLLLRSPRPATEPRDAPTRNSHENTEKIPSGPKFWNPDKIPRKYRRHAPKTGILGISGTFFGIFSVFWGYFWRSRISGREGIFSVFFVEIPGQGVPGLCSRSGRSQISLAPYRRYSGPSGPNPQKVEKRFLGMRSRWPATE